MKKTVKSLFYLLIGLIISCQLAKAQFSDLNNPQTIEGVKDMRAEIPDWKILKSAVYAGIPYPEMIDYTHWKAQFDEYTCKHTDYSIKWTSVTTFREINVMSGLSNEINQFNQLMGGNSELSKLMSIAGQQMGDNNSLSQVMQESGKTAQATTESDFAKELGLKYDQPKDHSPKLKAESEQLAIQVKKTLDTCDMLFAEAKGSMLDKELQDEVAEKTKTLTQGEFDAKVRQISKEWYRRNYLNDDGQGLSKIRKAEEFLIDTYLPLAEKRIFVDSKIYGFNPAMLLQELYLDAMIKFMGCRLMMLRQMSTCFKPE